MRIRTRLARQERNPNYTPEQKAASRREVLRQVAERDQLKAAEQRRRGEMRYRVQVAWHLRGNPWEAIDFLLGCRVRWVCRRHEAQQAVTVHEPGRRRSR